MSCSKSVQIQRYHDGELLPADRELIELHLRSCSPCRQLLTDLRRLSAVLSHAALPPMPGHATGIMQRCWRPGRDRGLLRAASWLTAAAAAILVAALLGWPVESTDAARAARAPVWQTAAVMPPVQEGDEAGSHLAVLAQWMADDLAVGREGDLR